MPDALKDYYYYYYYYYFCWSGELFSVSADKL